MTFRSLYLEEHVDERSAKQPYSAGSHGLISVSLNAYTWRSSLSNFAEAHALSVDYVDNCWIRVAVDADMARRFLETGAPDRSDTETQKGNIKDDRWYVINEEEF